MARTSSWLIPTLSSCTMLLAFFLAPQFPQIESMFKPYAKYSLSILLFINALHINYRSLGKVLLRRPLLLIYGILVKNILLPLAAFAVCYLLWPMALPAAVLISGISSGFSAVSFAILLRLAPEVNLLLTLGSSFAVPFSLPYLLYVLASSSVEIDVMGMMFQMAWMVFVPVLLERSLFVGLRRLHAWAKQHSQPIVAVNLSTTSFILMLSGQRVLRQQAADFWYILGFAAFMIVFIYVFSLLFFYRATMETQLMILTGNLVSNTGMASVLALDYLDSSTLAISIVFSVIWNFNIVFLRAWPQLRKVLPGSF